MICMSKLSSFGPLEKDLARAGEPHLVAVWQPSAESRKVQWGLRRSDQDQNGPECLWRINEPHCQWHLQHLRFGDVLNLQCGVFHHLQYSEAILTWLSTCQHVPSPPKNTQDAHHQTWVGRLAWTCRFIYIYIILWCSSRYKQIASNEIAWASVISGGQRSSESISNCLETWHSGCGHCRC